MLRSLARGTRDWLRRQARLRTFRRQFTDFERLAGDGARLPLRWEDRQPCLDMVEARFGQLFEAVQRVRYELRN